MKRMTLGVLFILIGAAGAVADDWPAVGHDSARSGITSESLEAPLSLQWVFRAPTPPARGWNEPETTQVYGFGVTRIRKIRYDDCYPVVVADGSVVFSASGENAIHALDAASGTLRWSVQTAGSPRLAPAISNGRVYFGADDGVVRCLKSMDGKEEWRFLAAPSADRALSQGRMLSLWPVRTGVLVEGGKAYFGAGLFPAEGLYLYCVDASTGELVWKNDTYDQDGTANISPQGYLLSDGKRLIVPSGRVSPAVFDGETGEFLFQVQNGRALVGGTYATLTPKYLYTGTQIIGAYDLVNPQTDRYDRKLLGRMSFSWFDARRVVVKDGVALIATPRELLSIAEDRIPAASKVIAEARQVRWDARNSVGAYTRAEKSLKENGESHRLAKRWKQEIERHRPKMETVRQANAKLKAHLDAACRWRLPFEAHDSMILAGNTIVSGGKNHVLAVDAATGKTLWKKPVEGTARALAVSDGRLYVSTTLGHIYCFGSGPEVGRRVAPDADASSLERAGMAEKADRILEESGIRRGHALVVGKEAGTLAYHLATRSDLRVHALEPDAARVHAVNAALARAQVYGSRVVVESGTGADLPYPRYFANLVVAAASEMPAKDVLRVLKPHGGTALIDGVGAAWTEEVTRAGVKSEASGSRVKLVRGALPGAGRWTHQYGNPGNTSSSEDTLADAPFGLLWFGDPGPRDIVNRHSQAAAPVSDQGRMFVQGVNRIQAFDAYNGEPLWDRRMDGALRVSAGAQGSNLALEADALFVVIDGECHRLDAATGKTVRTYPVPPRKDGAKRRWGWVSVEAGVLYGSRTETDRPFRGWPQTSGHLSEALFALDVISGRTLWVYDGKEIGHTAIAVGDGRVFILDGAMTEEERTRAARPSAPPELDRRGKPRKRVLRNAVAIDASSGKRIWSVPVDVTDFVVAPRGGEPNVLYARGTVVLCGSPNGGDHHIPEFKKGHFERRSIVALSGSDGSLRWSGAKNYLNRPTIVGDLVFAEPWGYDLSTGKQRTRKHPLTGTEEPWRMMRGAGGACGAISASANTLFFRTDTGAHYDLRNDSGITRRGGQRLSCWVNSITAGGLLLIPEGSAECDCPYAIQCTTVFVPREDRRPWGVYRFAKPLVPVRSLAVNLGAPGDTRDDDGKLWLKLPSRIHRWNWASLSFSGAGSGYDGALPVPGGQKRAWLYRSGGRGVTEFSVPLTEKGKPARYTIRLHLLGTAEAIEIEAQGKTVFPKAVLPSGPGMREFKGIQVDGKLTLRFRASGRSPVLCGLEAIREGE